MHVRSGLNHPWNCAIPSHTHKRRVKQVQTLILQNVLVMDDSRLNEFRTEKEGEGRPRLHRKRSASLDSEILLNWAVIHNDITTVKNLVERKNVRLNMAGVDGMFPLHRAASTGSIDCVKFLVQQGARINVYDENGVSPLDLAVSEGEFDCAQYLIQSGANINHIRNGFTDLALLNPKQTCK